MQPKMLCSRVTNPDRMIANGTRKKERGRPPCGGGGGGSRGRPTASPSAESRARAGGGAQRPPALLGIE
ncbi:hypothetical protein ZWY2020_004992 [Hordeum vulgare]|nr:hypothetical protein ZWY2020_004992 [Hordeum vulgare]